MCLSFKFLVQILLVFQVQQCYTETVSKNSEPINEKVDETLSALERIKSLPLFSWTSQKATEALKTVKSATEDYMPEYDYYLEKVEKVSETIIPVVEWTKQKSSDAYSGVKSATENLIPGSDYYIDQVEKMTASSAEYVSDTVEIITTNSAEYISENFNSIVGDDAIDKISKGANDVTNYGLDVVEKMYPVLSKSIEEATEYSKEIAAYYALRKFGLKTFSMSKKRRSRKKHKRNRNKKTRALGLLRNNHEGITVETSCSVKVRKPDGTSYEVKYTPFYMSDHGVLKTITGWFESGNDQLESKHDTGENDQLKEESLGSENDHLENDQLDQLESDHDEL